LVILALFAAVNWPITEADGPQDVKIGLTLVLWTSMPTLLGILLLRSRKRIYVFERGCVMSGIAKGVRWTIAWQDVTSLWQRVRDDIYMPSYEEPLFAWRYRMRLKLQDGTRVSWGLSVKDIGPLSVLVNAGVGRAQFPALLERCSGIRIPRHFGRSEMVHWDEVVNFTSLSNLSGWFYCPSRRSHSHVTLDLNGRLNTPTTILLLRHITAKA